MDQKTPTTKKILKDSDSLSKALGGQVFSADHLKLLEREDSVAATIFDFLSSGGKNRPVGYCFNDRRAAPDFFHKVLVKRALLARVKSYYQAALLLAEYVVTCNGEKGKKLLQQGLEAAYRNIIYNIELKAKAKTEKAKAKTETEKINFREELKKFTAIFEDYSDIYGSPPGSIFLADQEKAADRWEKALNEAEALTNWMKKSKIIVTLTSQSHNQQQEYILAQFDLPILSITPEQHDTFKNILNEKAPAWFEQLSPWQQAFWKDIVQEIQKKDLNDVLFTQPSTIRSYPSLPFYMHHGILIFKRKGNTDDFALHHKSVRCRSSVVVPYNLAKNKDECDELTAQNVQQLISNELPLAIVRHWHNKPYRKGPITVPILYQTLLSKVVVESSGENAMLKTKIDQFELFKKQFSALLNDNNVKYRFINTNYAINFAEEGKLLGKIAGKPVDNLKAIQTIIGCVCDYLNSVSPAVNPADDSYGHFTALLGHLAELGKNFDSPLEESLFRGVIASRWRNKNVDEIKQSVNHILEILCQYIKSQKRHQEDAKLAPNLLLATLENSLITAIGGLVLSSCKSGKDRNGILQMTTDACEALFALSGTVVGIHKKRNKFGSEYGDIIACLFKSGHHQLMASVNAQGCVGLKSVSEVLPKGILKKVQSTLGINDACANLNRPETVKGGTTLYFQAPSARGFGIDLSRIRGNTNIEKFGVLFQEKTNQPLSKGLARSATTRMPSTNSADKSSIRPNSTTTTTTTRSQTPATETFRASSASSAVSLPHVNLTAPTPGLSSSSYSSAVSSPTTTAASISATTNSGNVSSSAVPNLITPRVQNSQSSIDFNKGNEFYRSAQDQMASGSYKDALKFFRNAKDRLKCSSEYQTGQQKTFIDNRLEKIKTKINNCKSQIQTQRSEPSSTASATMPPSPY